MEKMCKESLPRFSEPGPTQQKRAWGRMWPARRHRVAILL